MKPTSAHIAQTVHAEHHAIASGHTLATEAGLEILEAGGNAVDAGVAAGIVLSVVHPDLVNFAGVAPIILRMAQTGQVVSLDGLGVWPKAASAQFFADNYDGAIPEGLLRTVVPAAPAAWITALRDYGTMRFADVSAAAIRHAREGFEVYPLFANFLAGHAAQYARYPANGAIFLPGGNPPVVGDTFVQNDLAATIQYMADEETAADGNRSAVLQAAYDAFYSGDIAQRIAAHHHENGGLMTAADLSEYRIRYEPPVQVRFQGHDVFCCGPWCQGISLAQAMAMLEQDDLSGYSHSDPAYIHRVTEILKLVFADREALVADPTFVDVPIETMLSPNYLRQALSRIDDKRAFDGMPSAGNIDPYSGTGTASNNTAEPRAIADTSHVCVIDKHGNMFAATPSDTSSDTEVIPGLGICPSSRGSQSRGIVGHLNAVAAGKRPRLTPNPALVLKDGMPFMAFGTPGGDVQIQAMAQVLLNMLQFGMSLSDAIEHPRFASYSFPSSFAPNEYLPGRLMIEEPLATAVCAPLTELGHDAQPWGAHTWKAGGICAVQQTDDGALIASADSRRAGKAGGR